MEIPRTHVARMIRHTYKQVLPPQSLDTRML